MFELRLRVTHAWVESVSDALTDDLGALAVSVEDADAGTDAEQPLFGEPGMPAQEAAWGRSTLSALFDSEAAAEGAAAWLLAQEGAADLELQGLAAVEDRDWVRQTQSQFDPIPITPGFWIVPSWHVAPPDAQRVIRLDPGMAFGTGSHPTTRMCLRWIARHASRWPTVLDYGCGSGILAIAAALHGAQAVVAVDIDPGAVEATRTNAARNGVGLRASDPPTAHGEHALVLANILASPLKLLAPVLAGHVAPLGQLVLAGLLERQADDLIGTYAPWLELGVADREEGWVLLAGARAS